jgi:hypothetical protein
MNFLNRQITKGENMSIRRTAQGKSLDMAALAARHETMRAVSNMSMNARGDTVDSTGRIIESATDKVNKAYVKTVGSRSAQDSGKGARQTVVSKAKAESKIDLSELNEIERSLEEDDLGIEKLKQDLTKKK